VGRDLSHPSWRERPAVVVEMLRKLLEVGSPERASGGGERQARLAERVGAQVAAGFGGTVRRLAFERCLAWCREYYALRENMRYHADLFLTALRDLALRAGDALVAAGALDARDDVFYLQADELQAALVDRARASGLAERAAERRTAYARDAGLAVPDTLRGAGSVVEPELEPEAAARHALSGLGVSPGRAVGRARVVHSVQDLQSLRAGEVIVAASTDPSWTSLLALGGALVLEMGGLLSHGAIVARELGIPAVVNVAQATRLLATGDEVIVDGRAGTVALA
jgi:pyruvate,water dikinase